MMTATIDAIFEGGAFRILHPSHLLLRDGQRVRLVVETQETPDTDTVLDLAAQVYAELPSQARQELEQHTLGRRPFFGDHP